MCRTPAALAIHPHAARRLPRARTLTLRGFPPLPQPQGDNGASTSGTTWDELVNAIPVRRCILPPQTRDNTRRPSPCPPTLLLRTRHLSPRCASAASQASEAELRKALRDVGALCIDGRYMSVDAGYAREVLDNLLLSAAAVGVPLSAVDEAKVVESMKGALLP